MALHVDSPWEDLAAYARDNNLDALVIEKDFVDTVYARAPDMFNDAYLSMIEILVDRFHDRFQLTAAQRKRVNKSIVDRSTTLLKLYDSFTSTRRERD